MKRVLFTCGVGDFIAMESYFTAAEREDVEAIHWASRARQTLMELVPFVFQNVKEHIIERDSWGPPFSRTFCISSRRELPRLNPSVHDWSVKIIVGEVRHRLRHYRNSTLVAHQLCNISHLNLPPYYFAVHPYSDNARTPIRDLTHEEWRLAHARLQDRNIPLVVVNRGDELLQSLPGVIDLTNKLTLLEAIEVTKHAAGFIGAASVFSVVASKTLPSNRLFIKGSRDLKLNYSAFYYAPHKTNSFVNDSLLGALACLT
jgi:hypothetical protein